MLNKKIEGFNKSKKVEFSEMIFLIKKFPNLGNQQTKTKLLCSFNVTNATVVM